MTAHQQDDSGLVGTSDARSTVEARTTLVRCDPDLFGPMRDVARSIDDALRRLSSDGELVDVALAPVSFPAYPGDVPGTTGVLVTAIVRTTA